MIDKEKNTFIMEVQGAFQGKKAVTLKSALKRENEKNMYMYDGFYNDENFCTRNSKISPYN